VPVRHWIRSKFSSDAVPYTVYRQRFSRVEGFFTQGSQAVWDYLLGAQSSMAVGGGFMEVGVFRGKSAFLGALHVTQDEPVVLVDISDPSSVVDEIRTFHRGKVASFTGKSSSFRASELYEQYRGTIRFFHVDGDHSGFATYGDVTLASEMVGSRALISIDDFGNMRYPQLHAAIYKFLFARPDFQMVLCGENKAYLCHAEDFAVFDELLRKHLVPHMARLGCQRTLARTSYAHDFGCFAIQDPVEGRPLIGRDEDQDDIVF
jgi:Methyltransferase domain